MFRLMIMVMVAATASACGESFCDRLEAAQTRFFAGKTSCEYREGNFTMSVSPAEGAQCTGALSACTPEEQEALEGYVACLEKAPPCTTGNESAAVEAQLACAFGANPTSLSAACLKTLE
ncbi:MAG: hypothetical protein WBV82_10780 [Myxococcaceae bacterium]